MARKTTTRKPARKPTKKAAAKVRKTRKPAAKTSGSRALVAKAKPASKGGLARSAKRSLATVVRDAEIVGAKVIAEGISVAKAGRKGAAEAVRIATPVAKRTTRTAARGIAGAARAVEHAAEAVAEKLK